MVSLGEHRLWGTRASVVVAHVRSSRTGDRTSISCLAGGAAREAPRCLSLQPSGTLLCPKNPSGFAWSVSSALGKRALVLLLFLFQTNPCPIHPNTYICLLPGSKGSFAPGSEDVGSERWKQDILLRNQNRKARHVVQLGL